MNRALLASVVTAALAAGAPGAYAAADSDYIGGCSFTSLSNVIAGQGEQPGEIDIQTIVFSQATPSDNPVVASVRCFITVNGASQGADAEVIAAGTGVIVGSKPISYSSWYIHDDVQLCWTIDYLSNATPDVNGCAEATTTDLPPRGIIYPLTNPIVCHALSLLYPGAFSILNIDRDGDVSLVVVGDVYDCWPHDDPKPVDERIATVRRLLDI